jgi:predicted nuclease of predicted toxin-antitoxin system
MRLLIDENAPKAISDWLRAEGHDVLMAGEISAGAADDHWIELAHAEQRLIVTADRDFEELIFRDKLSSHCC